MEPTQAGFLNWVYNVMGVTPAQLPPISPAVYYAFTVAMALVNTQIQLASPIMYEIAVYNLGGDNLINWAQDQPGQTFFADQRKDYNMFNFIGGTISSSSDEGTSNSIATVEALTKLTIGQLQNLKTPWGRQYLSIAMSVGTNWGIS